MKCNIPFMGALAHNFKNDILIAKQLKLAKTPSRVAGQNSTGKLAAGN
jgi:hypothetical protein